MNKNKKSKFIIIAIMTLILVSCTDFLDKYPKDSIANETFWHTKGDADMALTGVYSRLQCPTYNYARCGLDVLGCNTYFNSNSWAVREISQGLMNESTGGIVISVFANCYTGISACNVFMDNIDKVNMDEALKTQYKGEVLFLRALHYFTLSEFYGGVPIYTKPPTIAESLIPKSTKEEVIKLVLEDLEFAIASLPNTSYAGHAVKGSALALKAKVLLHNERWAEAADAANQVIKDGIFSLYNDYLNMFLTKGQTNNPEIMFSTQYLNPDNYTVSSGYDITFGYEACINPYQDFVDCFECIDGLPISSSPLYDPAHFRANRDPRLKYTVKLKSEPTVRSDGYTSVGANPSLTDYLPVKYMDPEIIPFSYAIRSDQDHILLRYSDVLLMYAEAKNEVNGPDLSVYNAINAVRGREGVNMPPLPSGLDKSAMRQRIMQERRVEFGLEGTRYQDIKRWKTIEAIYPTIKDAGTGLPLVFNAPRDYLLPFPLGELDINPNLVQNPGF